MMNRTTWNTLKEAAAARQAKESRQRALQTRRDLPGQTPNHADPEQEQEQRGQQHTGDGQGQNYQGEPHAEGTLKSGAEEHDSQETFGLSGRRRKSTKVGATVGVGSLAMMPTVAEGRWSTTGSGMKKGAVHDTPRPPRSLDACVMTLVLLATLGIAIWKRPWTRRRRAKPQRNRVDKVQALTGTTPNGSHPSASPVAVPRRGRSTTQERRAEGQAGLQSFERRKWRCGRPRSFRGS